MAIYVGIIGKEILVRTNQDLSESTKTEYHVTKPDGSLVTWRAEKTSTFGELIYVTKTGDLDQAGAYLVTAYVEWGSTSNYLSDPDILIVREQGYDKATYLGTPSERPIDAVRLNLGREACLDLITDDEIEFNLARAGNNIFLAAAFSAEAIAGFYVGLVDKSMGGSSVSLSQKAEAWRKKANALRTQASNSSLTPRATTSRARRPLKFDVGQHDFHWWGR